MQIYSKREIAYYMSHPSEALTHLVEVGFIADRSKRLGLFLASEVEEAEQRADKTIREQFKQSIVAHMKGKESDKKKRRLLDKVIANAIKEHI